MMKRTTIGKARTMARKMARATKIAQRTFRANDAKSRRVQA